MIHGTISESFGSHFDLRRRKYHLGPYDLRSRFISRSFARTRLSNNCRSRDSQIEWTAAFERTLVERSMSYRTLYSISTNRGRLLEQEKVHICNHLCFAIYRISFVKGSEIAFAWLLAMASIIGVISSEVFVESLRLRRISRHGTYLILMVHSLAFFMSF